MLGFTRSILFRALALGLAAGMRSQSPGAVLAYPLWMQFAGPSSSSRWNGTY